MKIFLESRLKIQNFKYCKNLYPENKENKKYQSVQEISELKTTRKISKKKSKIISKKNNYQKSPNLKYQKFSKISSFQKIPQFQKSTNSQDNYFPVAEFFRMVKCVCLLKLIN